MSPVVKLKVAEYPGPCGIGGENFTLAMQKPIELIEIHGLLHVRGNGPVVRARLPYAVHLNGEQHRYAIPRSTSVRGVLESLVKSKRYALPLVSMAAIHPAVSGSLVFAWFEGERFTPGRHAEETADPPQIAWELETNGVAAGD